MVDITINSVKVTKGPMFGKNEVLHTELTAEMLASGDWKNLSFKPVNANAKGKESEGGHLHPLMKVRTQFREILLELGFEEMPTDRYALIPSIMHPHCLCCVAYVPRCSQFAPERLLVHALLLCSLAYQVGRE